LKTNLFLLFFLFTELEVLYFTILISGGEMKKKEEERIAEERRIQQEEMIKIQEAICQASSKLPSKQY